MFLVSMPTSARMSRPSYISPKWTKLRSPSMVTEFPSTDAMVNLSACNNESIPILLKPANPFVRLNWFFFSIVRLQFLLKVEVRRGNDDCVSRLPTSSLCVVLQGYGVNPARIVSIVLTWTLNRVMKKSYLYEIATLPRLCDFNESTPPSNLTCGPRAWSRCEQRWTLPTLPLWSCLSFARCTLSRWPQTPRPRSGAQFSGNISNCSFITFEQKLFNRRTRLQWHQRGNGHNCHSNHTIS